MYDKDYYENNKDFLSQVARERYASNQEYQEAVKRTARKHYETIKNNKELKQLYNEKMRNYMREYRKRKKNKL